MYDSIKNFVLPRILLVYERPVESSLKNRRPSGAGFLK